MKTRKVILNIGLPASGKSTWTREFLRKNPEWVSVSRDDFRSMLRNEQQLDYIGEDLVTTLVTQSVRHSLLHGYNVIVDNTHAVYKHLNRAIRDFSDIADVDFRYFDTSLDVCLERDSKRAKPVGEAVIRELHEELCHTLELFDFQPVPRKVRSVPDYTEGWSESLPTAVLCDIDGTVAHMQGNRGPFDWKRVGHDDPDHVVIGVLDRIRKGDPSLRLVMISGRDEVCRPETEQWLEAAGVRYDALFMRPKDDYRKDSLVKREIYEREILGKYNVLCVFDDRDQVVREWRRLGLKCMQVEYGFF